MDELIFRKEIMRTGTFSDSAGVTHTFNSDYLDQIQASYNPDDPAPVVLGHPTNNDAPAFGWVTKLSRTGDRLVATIRANSAEFMDWVRNGRYPKVSVSLHQRDSTSNPTPGKPNLRHLGFLGGASPAIPGLAPANLNAEDDYITVDLTDTETPINTVVADQFADQLAVINERKAELDSQAAAQAAREVEFAAKQNELDERDTAIREAARKEVVHKWITEGKLPPAFADKAQKIYAALQEPQSADFCEGLAADNFVALMDGMSKTGLFSVLEDTPPAPRMSADTAGKLIANYAAENNLSLSEAQQQLASERKIPGKIPGDMTHE
ncbi:hypothetical protein NQX30_05595 [Candidatus Persebacteraceae bacterium Df01]|jgi:hypothetical protein|uniref:Peptidase n=1 Tax=Candidatus Doriopsillibacter californiensis TaxID=2970740 RepID=A0ABT7QN48_9GAMM|nr:hypothetical protein [Candidatus Persebacteraceae bacterium Df01]